MGLSEFFAFQEELKKKLLAEPMAWLLQANPVWGRSETVNRIALFDTKAAAERYLESSKLPALPKDADHEIYKTEDGYYRTFRPDSLLWDYNCDAGGMHMIVPAIPWLVYEGVQQNPLPLLGEPPKIEGFYTDHPKYGRDYDVGFGGPHTDTSRALPAAPPAAPPETDPAPAPSEG